MADYESFFVIDDAKTVPHDSTSSPDLACDNEAQAINTESKTINTESQAINTESQAINTESYTENIITSVLEVISNALFAPIGTIGQENLSPQNEHTDSTQRSLPRQEGNDQEKLKKSISESEELGNIDSTVKNICDSIDSFHRYIYKLKEKLKITHDKLVEQHDFMKQWNEQYDEFSKKKETEIRNLQKKNDEYVKTLEQIQCSMKEKENEINTLRENLTQKEDQEKQNILALTEKYTKEMENLQSEIKRENKELDIVNEKFEKMKSTLKEKVEEINTLQDNFTREVNQEKQNTKMIEEKYTVEVTNLRSQITCLTKELYDTNNELKNVNTSFEENEDQLCSLRKTFDELTTQHAETLYEKTEYAEEIKCLSSKGQSLQSEVDKMVNELKMKADENKDLSVHLMENERVLHDLQKEHENMLLQHDENLNAWEQSTIASKKMMENLESKITRITEEVQIKQIEVDELRSILSERNEEQSLLEAENVKFRKNSGEIKQLINHKECLVDTIKVLQLDIKMKGIEIENFKKEKEENNLKLKDSESQEIDLTEKYKQVCLNENRLSKEVKRLTLGVHENQRIIQNLDKDMVIVKKRLQDEINEKDSLKKNLLAAEENLKSVLSEQEILNNKHDSEIKALKYKLQENLKHCADTTAAYELKQQELESTLRTKSEELDAKSEALDAKSKTLNEKNKELDNLQLLMSSNMINHELSEEMWMGRMFQLETQLRVAGHQHLLNETDTPQQATSVGGETVS